MHFGGEEYKLVKSALKNMGLSTKKANRITKQIITIHSLLGDDGKYFIKLPSDFVVHGIYKFLDEDSNAKSAKFKRSYLSRQRSNYYENLRTREYKKQQENTQSKAKRELVNKIRTIKKEGIFKNGVLIDIKDKKLLKEYKGVKLLNHVPLEDLLSNDKDFRRIDILEYHKSKYRFRSDHYINLIRYPSHNKVYQLGYQWDDINVAFMYCFRLVVNEIAGNETKTRKLRRINEPLSTICNMLRPDYPHNNHGCVSLFKANLFKLSELYDATSPQFKDGFEELVEEADISLIEVFKLLTKKWDYNRGRFV